MTARDLHNNFHFSRTFYHHDKTLRLVQMRKAKAFERNPRPRTTLIQILHVHLNKVGNDVLFNVDYCDVYGDLERKCFLSFSIMGNRTFQHLTQFLSATRIQWSFSQKFKQLFPAEN